MHHTEPHKKLEIPVVTVREPGLHSLPLRRLFLWNGPHKKQCKWKCSCSPAGPAPPHSNTNCWSTCVRCNSAPYGPSFSKMRSVPLLFIILIACSIFAVCPLPISTHAEPESTKVEFVLTFINGQTGHDKPGEFPSRFHGGFTNSLRFSGIFQGVHGIVKMKYIGRFEPENPNQEEWVYFKFYSKVAGALPAARECTELKPCFGWRARGRAFDGSGNLYRKTYVGISEGPLAYQGFKGIWGRPTVNLEQAERWDELLDILNKKFMKPLPLPLLSFPANHVHADRVPLNQHPTYGPHFTHDRYHISPYPLPRPLLLHPPIAPSPGSHLPTRL
ncbi:hypothetical protein BDP27DRAFT_223631 [Rhodocollybia butyracea]|uniref:Uncharacterized protein n=1 Tax=Rhodocollybia butyracea TaxID=206335 RepID=A0A9P5Q3V1_9AGAR|nr:hypothetical protein BDP27DRAFT_223631 [Rhodocollybia butyracea]